MLVGAVGNEVGDSEGETDGLLDGEAEGLLVGAVGAAVGEAVGLLDGEAVGLLVGRRVGLEVGTAGSVQIMVMAPDAAKLTPSLETVTARQGYDPGSTSFCPMPVMPNCASQVAPCRCVCVFFLGKGWWSIVRVRCKDWRGMQVIRLTDRVKRDKDISWVRRRNQGVTVSRAGNRPPIPEATARALRPCEPVVGTDVNARTARGAGGALAAIVRTRHARPVAIQRGRIIALIPGDAPVVRDPRVSS